MEKGYPVRLRYLLIFLFPEVDFYHSILSLLAGPLRPIKNPASRSTDGVSESSPAGAGCSGILSTQLRILQVATSKQRHEKNK
jgi:hypothetical protein